MNLKISFFICVSFMIEKCFGDSRPEVKIKYGTYRGHIIKSKGGKDILAFSGVPFAKPPIGKLRFKEPVGLDLDEMTHNATKETKCIQVAIPMLSNSNDLVGSEDCLHLNIYTTNLNPSKLLPVYFWIHGGAYFAGSGSEAWNGPGFLLDEDRDMVLVAINYRLGIFGFLSANDDNLPGNLGLKDQTMALKWVNENIESFGGDPNSITIGGASAGAASVSLHLKSKASKGLFHRAISESGTADCIWTLKTKEEARDVSSKIINYLNCPTEPNKLLDCLQKQSIDMLMNSIDKIKVTKTQFVIYLAPVIEKDSPTAFITKESMKEDSHDVPWLSGITSEEALLFYEIFGMAEPGISDLSILEQNYKEILPILAYYAYSPEVNEISEKLKDYYFGENRFSQESINKFVQLLSDVMFNHGLHISSKNYKGDLFVYMLSHKGEYSTTFMGTPGFENSTTHNDEIFYLFPTAISGELTGFDLELSNIMLRMWYNFIKTGDPSPDTQIWEKSDGHKYLDFTSTGPIMKTDFFKERMEFLDKLNIASFLNL